jgi:hypothetical protein
MTLTEDRYENETQVVRGVKLSVKWRRHSRVHRRCDPDGYYVVIPCAGVAGALFSVASRQVGGLEGAGSRRGRRGVEAYRWVRVRWCGGACTA